ncbi:MULTISPECIES: DUF1697 domain-containing protein [unclassified Roseitalea]|uniref:DUF1697 domain-containing protein n=1 Tax=unclassified Roseitalea TaxID=2639107 RepID=UPI00273DF0CD|nr:MULTISPECIES: DUF1697 domain-containing protein [unclassified Roseitalea]
MKTFIALLRGVNVGGNNVMAMAQLRTLLTGLGYADVKTYIQSGNCMFRSSKSDPGRIAAAISAAIAKTFGFSVQTIVMSLDVLEAAIAANPYAAASEDDQKRVHLFFLPTPATGADLHGLQALKKPSESYTLTRQVLYLHAPEGIGRSPFAAQAEQMMGVMATARNLRTAMKIAEMARQINEKASVG